MTNEELVAQIQTGHKELMPDLWKAVSGFVAQQARKAAGRYDVANDRKGYDAYDDFYDTGYLAVCDAAQTFDSERGAVFLTHLGVYLKKHFGRARANMSGWKIRAYDELRKKGMAAIVSLNRRKYGEDSEDESEIIDTLADTDDAYEALCDRWYAEDLHDILERMLNKLPSQLSDMVRKKYYEGMTTETIANVYDISQAHARAMIAQAMRELLREAQRTETRRALLPYIGMRTRHTDFYYHVGVNRFQSTGASAVEEIFMYREEAHRKLAYDSLRNNQAANDRSVSGDRK